MGTEKNQTSDGFGCQGSAIVSCWWWGLGSSWGWGQRLRQVTNIAKETSFPVENEANPASKIILRTTVLKFKTQWWSLSTTYSIFNISKLLTLQRKV